MISAEREKQLVRKALETRLADEERKELQEYFEDKQQHYGQFSLTEAAALLKMRNRIRKEKEAKAEEEKRPCPAYTHGG